MPGFPPSTEEIAGVSVGASSVFLMNFMQSYPAFSRLPRYAVFTTVGYFAGVWATKLREWKIHQKEVYMWDYINQHPNDFPELTKEPTRLKDVLEKWTPVR